VLGRLWSVELSSMFSSSVLVVTSVSMQKLLP
jgi:hypothetical protein